MHILFVNTIVSRLVLRTSLATSLLVLSIPVAVAQQTPARLPVVKAPIGFDEGTETALTAEQRRELLPWSFDSKTELNRILGDLPKMSPSAQLDTLDTGIRRLVQRSGGSRSGLLMRYVLNRGLLISAELAQNSQSGEAAGGIFQRIRILRRSAEFAVKYAQSDAAFLNTPQAPLPYAQFGIEYAQFLMALSQSILNSSSQYRVMRLALGFLAWDLYHDDRKLQYAPAITDLQLALEGYSESPGQGDSALVQVLPNLKSVFDRAMLSLGIEMPKPVRESESPAGADSNSPISRSRGSRNGTLPMKTALIDNLISVGGEEIKDGIRMVVVETTFHGIKGNFNSYDAKSNERIFVINARLSIDSSGATSGMERIQRADVSVALGESADITRADDGSLSMIGVQFLPARIVRDRNLGLDRAVTVGLFHAYGRLESAPNHYDGVQNFAEAAISALEFVDAKYDALPARAGLDPANPARTYTEAYRGDDVGNLHLLGLEASVGSRWRAKSSLAISVAIRGSYDAYAMYTTAHHSRILGELGLQLGKATELVAQAEFNHLNRSVDFESPVTAGSGMYNATVRVPTQNQRIRVSLRRYF